MCIKKKFVYLYHNKISNNKYTEIMMTTGIKTMRELRKAYENKAYKFNRFLQHDKTYFKGDREHVLDVLSNEYYIATKRFEEAVDSLLKNSVFTMRDVIDYTRAWKQEFKY